MKLKTKRIILTPFCVLVCIASLPFVILNGMTEILVMPFWLFEFYVHNILKLQQNEYNPIVKFLKKRKMKNDR